MSTRDNDIVENAANAGQFRWLGDALKAAGLIDTYKGDGPFTFFAPTDEAFEKIPPGALRRLLENKAKLAEILNYHVVPGVLLHENLEARDERGEVIELVEWGRGGYFSVIVMRPSNVASGGVVRYL